MHAIRSANLGLRVASRVLLRVARFEARSFRELERFARRVDWSSYLAPGVTAQLNVTCRRSKLYHERAVEERVLAAIDRSGVAGTSAIRDLDVQPIASPGARDAPDARGSPPTQLFVVRFDRDHCTISADTSGELLHARGYRQALAKAPLRETLAAAMLLASGWSADRPLLDPLCGSGTIAIEAALIARRIAPGLPRAESGGFAFVRWPAPDETAWRQTIDRAAKRARTSAPAAIHASDRDRGAINAALANAQRAGVAGDIEFQQRALSAATSPGRAPWLVCNPPYGRRIGQSEPLRDLYAAFGNLIRRSMPDASLAILSADRRLDAQLGLPLDEILHTRNGGVRVRLVVARDQSESR